MVTFYGLLQSVLFTNSDPNWEIGAQRRDSLEWVPSRLIYEERMLISSNGIKVKILNTRTA